MSITVPKNGMNSIRRPSERPPSRQRVVSHPALGTPEYTPRADVVELRDTAQGRGPETDDDRGKGALVAGGATWGYRIMEVKQRAPDSLDGATEIGEYDSAYRAMEDMKRAVVQRGRTPPPWYLVDPSGQVLLGPDDLYEFAA